MEKFIKLSNNEDPEGFRVGVRMEGEKMKNLKK